MDLGRFVGGAAILMAVASAANARPGRPAGSVCGTTPFGLQDALGTHAQHQARSARTLAAREGSRAAGDVAVMQDAGDLVVRKNFLDLPGVGLEFSPQNEGYAEARVDRRFAAPPAPATLALADDDTRLVALPFAFRFYGKTYTDVFVNSDGNLTFGAGDSASTDRSIGRFLGGPPRVAPLLTDLDPSKGGTVSTRAEAGQFVVTWAGVPYFDKAATTTFQVALNADGRIDFLYDASLSISLSEGVAGIAPGDAARGVTPVDFSTAGASGTGALAEAFSENDTLDLVAVARRFYGTYADAYQQLVIFTSSPLVRGTGAFAFESNVKNADAGIGLGTFDGSAAFGSRGVLESVVMMDRISKYPADLNAPVAGAESTLSVLGQEVGHRWLARALFKDGATISKELLGRDEAHWSFNLDTDGSHLEGNDIQDLGGGQFKTVAAGLRYSPLDQYLMGLRAPEEVPPFFVVRSPEGAPVASDRDPAVGVVITGVRRDIGVGDVIAAMGPRNPPAGAVKAPFRQAFIYVSLGAPDPALAARVEQIRAAWGPFFTASTDGRGTVETTLR